MQYDTLSHLISALELGTKTHISVVFLDHYGNGKTRLSTPQKIHTCAVCDEAKSTQEGYSTCFRCRNAVLKLAVKRKRSFGGLCAKGVYEYCRPVVRKGAVIAVIFVGNILTDSAAQRKRLLDNFSSPLLQTMESGVSPAQCVQLADITENYIQLLLDKYGDREKSGFDPLLENIKSYIDENYLYEFSMEELAGVFGYNEKYLGRLFKAKTGYSVKDYCNHLKIEKAKGLLIGSDKHIADIATQVGYSNVTYFNRIFRALTGMSPQAYRKG